MLFRAARFTRHGRPWSRAALGFVLILATAAAGAQECPEPLSNDPLDCERLWEGIGLPESNNDEAGNEFKDICHLQYLAHHNNQTRTPDWVIERLTAEMVSGGNTRPSKSFTPDPCVPTKRSAQNRDYTNSLYARGHQAASADFSADEKWMEDTFVFSNAVPQEGAGFNSSIWSQLEDRVRDIAVERGEVYVVTGPVYQDVRGKDVVVPKRQNPCGRRIELPALPRKQVCGGNPGPEPEPSCNDRVAIPAGLFKIIVDPQLGRVNAYLLPNIDHPSGAERRTSTDEYLGLWRVSVLNLEDRTGYTFLPEFDRHDRRAQKESCPATMLR